MGKGRPWHTYNLNQIAKSLKKAGLKVPRRNLYATDGSGGGEGLSGAVQVEVHGLFLHRWEIDVMI